MKEDILITARILSKEWQIKKYEKIIKDNTESIEKITPVIELLDDDMPNKGAVTYRKLQSLLKEIDKQEALRLVFKKDLQKLNNADGYCYCESCVANRARAK